MGTTRYMCMRIRQQVYKYSWWTNEPNVFSCWKANQRLRRKPFLGSNWWDLNPRPLSLQSSALAARPPVTPTKGFDCMSECVPPENG